ncbi:putative peptide modification system cyclase [Pseudoxanthomonas sacheonensis]|uniref:Peptide modification system cyclase n=1 Tax=Pseudoxanthomonas sacheonensis TaxID=443615 RepID=A0ABU1RTB8_9GAMM|nr:putative peptide modification system cyclase [Pseudoxanthomonas sacheonensis]MDR6842026.1 putative peptide modification system cyclase [Pseudoxanthomonas sacheonensis]
MNDIGRLPLEGPQLRTLLLTDLVDSTGLVERLGDTPASELFREHDRLVLKLQQEWRGRLIDRSDGLLLLFERPIDGLGFALDYTRGLRELGKARELELQARAGLHVGEVLTWKNSDAAVLVGAKPLEVEGLAKPMAARLMTLARPGQILLSAVAESLTHRAARELGERGQNLLWKSYGRWRFKGVPEAQEIYEVGEVGIAPLRSPSSIAKAWRDTPLWRRPAALAVELLLVAGLGIGAWFLTKPQPAIAFAERDWVVVGDLRNLTGEKVLDDSLSQAFRISLEQSRYVNVLSDMKARDTLARMQRKPGTLLDRSVASEIALRDGVRAVILPTVSEVGGRVRVSAEVIDPRTQTTVYAETADGVGAGTALDSIDTVTAKLRGKLGEALASIEKDSEPLPQVTTRNLDALRAYALGQKSFARSRYKEAQDFYARATKIDPEFALAYIGLLRAHNAINDLSGGVPYLRTALKLRESLPPRDQLYLEAWAAEVDDPARALEKWQLMANLYPDFFRASANVGYALHGRNRCSEGQSFAIRATSPKSEFSSLSWDLVGRLALCLEQYEKAEQAFRKAGAADGTSAALRLANTYASQRQFSFAEKAWPRNAGSGVPFDLVSIYLDQGRWKEARKEADGLKALAGNRLLRAREATYPLAVVHWLEGESEASLSLLNSIVDESLAAVPASPANSEAVDDMYLTLSAGLLAQRMGDTRLARRIMRALQERRQLLEVPPLGSLYVALKANDLRMAGKTDAAVSTLEATVDGSEPFQTHQALLEAYAGAAKNEKALNEAAWLTRNRGRAYSELGCSWCQQALNVADTTLAHLRTAELQASLGRTEKARQALAQFDRQWQTAGLPDHLRVRRSALLATFN